LLKESFDYRPIKRRLRLLESSGADDFEPAERDRGLGVAVRREARFCTKALLASGVSLSALLAKT
jgi:hypothetical protein